MSNFGEQNNESLHDSNSQSSCTDGSEIVIETAADISDTKEILDDIITTVGSFRRLILEPEPSQMNIQSQMFNDQNSEYVQITESNIKRRKIKYMEDPISTVYLDIQPWRTRGTVSKYDVIDSYKSACFNLKIRSHPQLLEQLENVHDFSATLEEFNLRGIKFDSKHLEALDVVFKQLKCGIISFAKCCLEDDFIISICEMVEYYQCANHLVFAHNPKIKTRGWIHLGRMIRRCPFVESLDMGYCAIDNLSLPMFLRCIRADCNLRILHIEGNGLSGKGMMILLAAMRFNTHLRELYLGRNNLNPEDALNLGEILKNNIHLEVIDIRDNAIQDRGLTYIVKSINLELQYSKLHSLFLTNNSITEFGLDVLSELLKSKSSLKTLSLSGNNIGNIGVQKLKSSLLLNKWLSKLGLRNTRMSCEGAIAIAEVLAESRSIEVLDLRGNDIRIAGLMALSLAHRINRSLLNLQIPENIKADQRDRQLIIDVLNDLVNFRTRNQSQREAMLIAQSFDPSLASHDSNIDSSNVSDLNLNLQNSSSLEVSIALGPNRTSEDREYNPENQEKLDIKFDFHEESVLTANPDDLAKYQISENPEVFSTCIDSNADVHQSVEYINDDKAKIPASQESQSSRKNLPDILGELNIPDNQLKSIINNTQIIQNDPNTNFDSCIESNSISRSNISDNENDSIYKVDLVSSVSLSKSHSSEYAIEERNL